MDTLSVTEQSVDPYIELTFDRLLAHPSSKLPSCDTMLDLGIFEVQIQLTYAAETETKPGI
jgi:hypothetical protein